MRKEELNKSLLDFLDRGGEASQEFADIFSRDKNWKIVDKNVEIPRGVGVAEEACPACRETVRYLYEKFSGDTQELALICPHCQKSLKIINEFTGYTNEPILRIA